MWSIGPKQIHDSLLFFLSDHTVSALKKNNLLKYSENIYSKPYTYLIQVFHYVEETRKKVHVTREMAFINCHNLSGRLVNKVNICTFYYNLHKGVLEIKILSPNISVCFLQTKEGNPYCEMIHHITVTYSECLLFFSYVCVKTRCLDLRYKTLHYM